MPLPNDILPKMLTAAEQAGGAQWGSFSNHLNGFVQSLAQNSAQIAVDYETGAINQQQARVLLDGISDATAMLQNYATETLRLAAQNAINAAIGVLWSAIMALK
jgi:hypothetical protein